MEDMYNLEIVLIIIFTITFVFVLRGERQYRRRLRRRQGCLTGNPERSEERSQVNFEEGIRARRRRAGGVCEGGLVVEEDEGCWEGGGEGWRWSIPGGGF